MSLPRRWAFAIRSQRGRVRLEVGRKLRSKSRERPTVPTIESSGIAWSPSERSPTRPSASTTSSKGRISPTSLGCPRSRAPIRASTARRRARLKSSWASELGKPVSGGGIASVLFCYLNGRREAHSPIRTDTPEPRGQAGSRGVRAEGLEAGPRDRTGGRHEDRTRLHTPPHRGRGGRRLAERRPRVVPAERPARGAHP